MLRASKWASAATLRADAEAAPKWLCTEHFCLGGGGTQRTSCRLPELFSASLPTASSPVMSIRQADSRAPSARHSLGSLHLPTGLAGSPLGHYVNVSSRLFSPPPPPPALPSYAIPSAYIYCTTHTAPTGLGGGGEEEREGGRSSIQVWSCPCYFPLGSIHWLLSGKP